MTEKMRSISKFLQVAVSSQKPKKMSQILCFPEAIPKEKSVLSSCKSLKLMLSKGYIKHVSPGVFNLMPLAVRSFEKLCNIVDTLMVKVDGQKVLFPTLIQESLMKSSGFLPKAAEVSFYFVTNMTTCKGTYHVGVVESAIRLCKLDEMTEYNLKGRWETIGNLFKLTDRHSYNYCLGPTHEEIASSLMSKIILSYKYLPMRFYQISSKFRDEMNPKLGLLRGREFIMKDMYTFDSSEETAKITYEAVCDVYEELFQLLGIKPIKVKAASGDIGGKLTHEFHFSSDVGEDEILYCPKCRLGMNKELENGGGLVCESCHLPLEKCKSIEVGHAFLLGTKYTEVFNANFDSANHTNENYQMGCYGLGLTRILAASVEYLSDADNIRWPLLVAPYLLSIIPPKKGSKEESVQPFADHLAESLNRIDWLSSNVLIDDRTSFTIGKRVQDASTTGIPFVVVVGKSAQEEIPKLEIIDVYNKQTLFLSHKETILFFRNKIMF